ncbi:MAG: hypothetical protein ACT4OZ_14035 [Gemmatimonadota bacterium]
MDEGGGPAEKRRNLLLRMLINEMLDQVREVQRHAGAWPTEERRQAEEALERIMTQVRSEALRRGEQR